MQISDLVGQYNRNISQDVSVAAPSPGVQKLVDAVRELTTGCIFEGTVNEMNKGEIVLGLSNGQTITARLAADMILSKGQSMFFQVKSNDGNQVEIRPYTKGNLSNPILLKALDSAGLSANDRTVAMVDSMMKEQMSIDKQSLLEMSRIVASQPQVDVDTIVQMKKLGLPVTEQMANQFQNYKMDQAAITSQMEDFFQGLPFAFSGEAMSGSDAVTMNHRIMQVLFQEAAAEVSPQSDVVIQKEPLSQEQQQVHMPNQSEIPAVGKETTESGVIREAEQMLLKQQDYEPGAAGRVLTDGQAKLLERQLLELPQLADNAELFENGKLNLKQSPKELLLALQKALQQPDLPKGDALKQMLADEPYQQLLKHAFEQEWLIKPEDLKTEDKIKDLYQKLENQMSQLEHIFEQAGMDKSQLMRATGDVRGNIEFMNQINQTYTYVQLPLKLSGQNAHSDLYVYSNKKSLADKDGELTAFLHLDLEHLGSTDVSVRMQGKKVHTDFFLADDASYALVMEHMDILEKRLEEKGYQCTIQVQNAGKKVDFVEDFLKKDQPSTGRLHRYSFDVRA